MIKINSVGKIVSGNYLGMFILINENDNGSYFIFLSDVNDFALPKELKSGIGYDYYIDNFLSLQSQFEYEGWEIEWLD